MTEIDWTGFQAFYENSETRKTIEANLLAQAREKLGDPNWTPKPQLGQDGGFFINLRNQVKEAYKAEHKTTLEELEKRLSEIPGMSNLIADEYQNTE